MRGAAGTAPAGLGVRAAPDDRPTSQAASSCAGPVSVGPDVPTCQARPVAVAQLGDRAVAARRGTAARAGRACALRTRATSRPTCSPRRGRRGGSRPRAAASAAAPSRYHVAPRGPLTSLVSPSTGKSANAASSRSADSLRSSRRSPTWRPAPSSIAAARAGGTPGYIGRSSPVRAQWARLRRPSPLRAIWVSTWARVQSGSPEGARTSSSEKPSTVASSRSVRPGHLVERGIKTSGVGCGRRHAPTLIRGPFGVSRSSSGEG